jgi:tetratricopeptide (TPR) repeat protein
LHAHKQPPPCRLHRICRLSGQKTSHNTYVYVDALAADLASNSSQQGGTSKDDSSSFWSWFGTATKNLGYLLTFVALICLTAIIPLLGWLHYQTRARCHNLKNRWPASWIRRPRLQIGTFDDGALKEKLGPPIAGLIRSEISQRKDRYGLHLVSGQTGVSEALGSLNEISGDVKTAVSVVKLLSAYLPTRHFILSGELQASGDQGPGISVALSKDSGVDYLYTFWARPLGLPMKESATCYQQLAVAAAAWVDHRMASAVKDDNLLTGDPLSWAYFRCAANAQQLGQTARARKLYERALAMDGGNVGALANLGTIESQGSEFDNAEKLLNEALERTQSNSVHPKLDFHRNPDWYRIEYQIAALHINWAAHTGASPEPSRHSDIARKVATRLALTTSQQVMDLKDFIATSQQGNVHTGRERSDKQSKGELALFLKGTIEPAALVVVAFILNPDGAPVEELSERPTRDRVVKLLEGLAQRTNAPQTNSESQTIVSELVAFVENGSARPPGTLFDLACLYTKAKEFDKAARRLTTSVVRSEPTEMETRIEAAENDPTLKPLFEERPNLASELKRLPSAQRERAWDVAGISLRPRG